MRWTSACTADWAGAVMFTDLPEPPSPHALWAAPLQERVKRMMQRPRRVAWVYRTPDTSTFRYRAANIVAALNADPHSDIGAAWFSEHELEAVDHLVGRLDAIVLVRYPFCAPLDRLVERARHEGVPLLFDSDDLVFDTEFAPLIIDALDEDPEDHATWSRWYSYLGQLNATMRRCVGGITTGRPLQAQMQAYFREDRVHVVPNFLDRAQESYSRQLLDAKRRSGWKRDKTVTIGYFSGSPTHARDFAVMVPALHRLLLSDSRVRLRVVGRLDMLGDLAELPADQIEVVGFMDYVELQRAIAEVEVNVAPLQHHEFTACKSELKYFEAAAVGTWTVASASPAFVGATRDGRTGRIARAHEWDDALAEAVDLARDTTAYAHRAEEAAHDVYERYGWNTMADRIGTAVAGALPADVLELVR